MANLFDKLKGVAQEFNATSPVQDKEGEKLNLFNLALNEDALANCFYGLYVHSAKGMKMYGEKEYDKLRFSAFLYYLVKDTCFKSDRLNQSSFYQFIQKKVFRDLKQNVRTFNNRVTELNILDKAMEHPTNYDKDSDFLDFQHLKKKFRKTSFFESLKRMCDDLHKF